MTKIASTLVFQITMYGCESWTGEKLMCLKYGVGGELCSSPGLPERWTSKWVLDQTRTISGGKMTKLRLSYFGNIIQGQGFLEQTVILGKVEGNRKRGWPIIKWMDSIKEATRMEFIWSHTAVEDRTFWSLLIHRVILSQRRRWWHATIKTIPVSLQTREISQMGVQAMGAISKQGELWRFGLAIKHCLAQA